MRRSAALLLSLPILVMTACAVGPDFSRPSVTTMESFRMMEAGSAGPSIANLPWWELLRDEELQKLIDERSNPWGVTVQSVEMRDVIIPDALQDAMSREAQAAREKQARIILGQAEVEIAHLFQRAAESYQENPTALHLRAMNMLYEGLKEKGALMLVPSTAVESMGMGGLLGAAAFRQQKLTEINESSEVE